MSRASAAEAGAQNYVIKKNFRRDLDQEVRREGYDYYGDFTGQVATGSQPFPATEEINLVHLVRSPTGKTALIAGTKTKLYMNQSLDYEYVATTPAPPGSDPTYVSGSGSDPYFAEYGWKVIGTGFSGSGKRWEVANINGTTILNNGVDLPVAFRIEYSEVKPLYELRDQAVASVGTISEFNNILMLGDIRQIPDSAFSTWMNGSTPYGPYTGGDEVRYQYRLLWSAVGEAEKFDASVTCTTTTGGSASDITLDWPSESFKAGDTVTVFGAGGSGGNLTTTISSINGTTFTLNDAASTATSSAILMHTGAIGSIVGYDDLLDDASGIMNMMELQGQLVIYKDTSIFLAVYTGVVTMPFKMTRLPVPTDKTLFYKNTLVQVEGLYHVYIGRNAFYRFDLQNRIPVVMKGLDLCSDLFFEAAGVDISSTDDVFASVNTLTKEIWFASQSTSTNKIICLDYKYNTVSTSDVSISAASAIKRQTLNIQPVETEDWFVMGTSEGTLLLYGRADKALSQWGGSDSIYYARKERLKLAGSTTSGSDQFVLSVSGSASSLSTGDEITVHLAGSNGQALTTTVSSVSSTAVTMNSNAATTQSATHLDKHMSLSSTSTNPYESRLKSGLTAFGDPFDEKDLRSYVPHLSSHQEPVTLGMSVNIYGTRNEHEVPSQLATRSIDNLNENMVSMFSRNFFFQDEIVINGKDNPAALHMRSYEISRLSSKSTSRLND